MLPVTIPDDPARTADNFVTTTYFPSIAYDALRMAPFPSHS